MNSRSCEVMISAPSKSRRKPSSQRIDSMSRWLVGSSRRSASGCIRRMRARAVRIFHPPESSPTSRSTTSGAKPRPARIARARDFEAVAVELVEAVLDVAEARDQLVEVVGARRIGHGELELVQLVGDGRDLAGAGDRLLEHAPPAHLADRLREVADRDPLLDQHAAGVGLLLADDHAKDGRLAGAVRADETDLLAAKRRHRRVEEEDAATMLFGDRLEPDHAGRRL